MVSFPGSLISTIHHVTEEQLVAYAAASGDHNPLHLDDSFAAGTIYGRRIAHGMLILAFLSEMLTSNFGVSWITGGTLRVKFRAPVYPGDTVESKGVLRAVLTKIPGVTYEVGVWNQDAMQVISGEARLLDPSC